MEAASTTVVMGSERIVDGLNRGAIAANPIKPKSDTHAFAPTVQDGKIVINGDEIYADPKSVSTQAGNAVIANVYGEIQITDDYPDGIVSARQGIFLKKGPDINGIGTSVLGCVVDTDLEDNDTFGEVVVYSGSLDPIPGGYLSYFDANKAEELRKAFSLPLKYQDKYLQYQEINN